MSPTSQTTSTPRISLLDSCHRKIRLIGGGPVAFLGGLVAKARRKDRDGDQNSTDTKLYLEESVLERKLPEADLKVLVDLPASLDFNEWLASHTLALFEHVNLMYGTISEFCAPSGCPDMTGPGNRTYLWFDEKGKKTRVAAPQYIDYVMTFTQKTVSDEGIFPTKYANKFPSSFESIARKILRLQFHVIAHLYAAHFREIALLGLHTHLNLTFAHLTALHRRFNLIDEKETEVLRDLEIALHLTDESPAQDHASLTTSSIADSAVTHSTTSAGMTMAETTATGSTVWNDACSFDHGNIASTQMRLMNPLSAASSCPLAMVIDGDAVAAPICTQPEAASRMIVATTTNSFIGVSELGEHNLGTIEMPLVGATSSVPIDSCSTIASNACHVPNSCSANSTCRVCNVALLTPANNFAVASTTVNLTNINTANGSAALNLETSSSSGHQQVHNQHPHHHQHQLPQQLSTTIHSHRLNSGLIQCNAVAPPASISPNSSSPANITSAATASTAGTTA